MFATMNLREKAAFVVVRALQVVASVTILAIPVDLMIRGADSVFGQFLINTMAGI